MVRGFVLVVLSSMVLALPSWAQEDADDADSTVEAVEAEDAPKFDFAVYAPLLAGSWEGELAYRDFQSNRRVTIPLATQTLAAGDGSYVSIAFTFTDPGYKVYSHTILQPIGSAGVRVADFNGGEMTVAVRAITEFAPSETGFTITYDEQGRDNGEPATLRHTETLDGDRYTLRRDVRVAGDDDFVFRNEISLTRTP